MNIGMVPQMNNSFATQLYDTSYDEFFTVIYIAYL